MQKDQIELFAANAAKDIVVASVTNTNSIMDADDGRDVVGFYTEIYNGIVNVLSNSSSKDTISGDK